MTDTRKYVIAGLRGDGYSGLCSEECGCELDDLMPCEEPRYDCSPGYKHACAECPRAAEDNCPIEDGGTGMCVGSTKDWPTPEEDEEGRLVMKPPACIYQRERDNFEITMPGRTDLRVVHVLTAEQANDLLYELQHAVWARQGAGWCLTIESEQEE